MADESADYAALEHFVDSVLNDYKRGDLERAEAIAMLMDPLRLFHGGSRDGGMFLVKATAAKKNWVS
jgi:hypothetical protein